MSRRIGQARAGLMRAMTLQEQIDRERWLMDMMNAKAAEHQADKWGKLFADRAEVHRWKLGELLHGHPVFTGC
jgi:hypothetical protein